ncbi:MAG: hypothetical protein EOO27_46530, partial [Comamonadaceae bacterium]
MTQTLAREAAAELARLGKRTGDGIGTTVSAVTPGLITTRDDRGDPREGVLAGSPHRSRPAGICAV